MLKFVRNGPPTVDPDYLQDCERIVAVMAKHGYEITVEQAYEAWTAYSDSMAAGWMCLGEDEEVLQDVRGGMWLAGYVFAGD